MMKIHRSLAALVATLMFVPAMFAQNNAHIGYVYPAGGRQGTSFQVIVGGQFLTSITNAFISGTGVEAEVLEYNRPLPQNEFNELRNQYRELQQKQRTARQNKRANPAEENSTNTSTGADEKLMAEIRARILKNPPNRQGNPAIAETVTLRVSIATNAPTGEREIRLQTRNALSNPLKFCIGQLPEFSKAPAKTFPAETKFLETLGVPLAPTNSEMRIKIPATLNGQIMPGAVDRFRFAARKGQQIVIAVSARELIPYLADAVPGWFQATLALYDSAGNEIAYNDDFRFHPDPILHCEIPRDGEYSVEIKDAIYRGREDFVYRIAIGELPFITDIFPLGGRRGEKTPVTLSGWNLPKADLVVDNSTNPPGIQPLCAERAEWNVDLLFMVDDLPDCLETEPNDSPRLAQQLTLPIIVNGRVEKADDADTFQFNGREGQEIVAEVFARRLGSPLDSVLRLTDASGKEIASNDDFEDKGAGLETHHADSCLRAKLPKKGTYFLRLKNVQQHGGPEFAYRLRVSEPRPDFDLRIVPSSILVRTGGSVPMTVYALRKDGFANAIDLVLQDPRNGIVLCGGRVPANQSQVRFTLTAPASGAEKPLDVQIAGRAVVNGREISHNAIPADDMMQAFAYQHLVPAQELKLAVTGNPRVTGRFESPGFNVNRVDIPAGGTTTVIFGPVPSRFLENFQIELSDPPEGILLQKATMVRTSAEFVFAADGEKAKNGAAGNLILSISPKTNRGNSQTARPANQRRSATESLPALPFEIVSQKSQESGSR